MISKFSLALGVAAVLGLSAMIPNNSRIVLRRRPGTHAGERRTDSGAHRSTHATRTCHWAWTSSKTGTATPSAATCTDRAAGKAGRTIRPPAHSSTTPSASVRPTRSTSRVPSDLIHEFSGYTSGFVTVTAKMYIPGDFTGDTYFIFENVYSDVDTNIISWSTQVIFRGATGTVENFDGSANPGSLPFVTDEWADLKLEIDLDADVQTFYYNGEVLYTGRGRTSSDQGVPGILNIGSIDLFAGAPTLSTPVYYDDLSIVPGVPSDFGVSFGAPSDALTGAPGDDGGLHRHDQQHRQRRRHLRPRRRGRLDLDALDHAVIAIPAGQSDVFNVTVEIPGDAVPETAMSPLYRHLARRSERSRDAPSSPRPRARGRHLRRRLRKSDAEPIRPTDRLGRIRPATAPSRQAADIRPFQPHARAPIVRGPTSRQTRVRTFRRQRNPDHRSHATGRIPRRRHAADRPWRIGTEHEKFGFRLDDLRRRPGKAARHRRTARRA